MATPRQLSSTGWYHAIGRGNNRQPLFLDRPDFERFLLILGKYLTKHPVKIAHYCLMPNHVHLLLFSELRDSLSKYLQGVNLSYSWWYRNRYDFCGHVWQGRFKSFPIEKESYLTECSRYIERNPVNAKIVTHPEKYPWSSYRFYSEGAKNHLVTPDPGYRNLASTEAARQNIYQSYVETARPYEIPDAKKLLPSFQGW